MKVVMLNLRYQKELLVVTLIVSWEVELKQQLHFQFSLFEFEKEKKSIFHVIVMHAAK